MFNVIPMFELSLLAPLVMIILLQPLMALRAAVKSRTASIRSSLVLGDHCQFSLLAVAIIGVRFSPPAKLLPPPSSLQAWYYGRYRSTQLPCRKRSLWGTYSPSLIIIDWEHMLLNLAHWIINRNPPRLSSRLLLPISWRRDPITSLPSRRFWNITSFTTTQSKSTSYATPLSWHWWDYLAQTSSRCPIWYPQVLFKIQRSSLLRNVPICWREASFWSFGKNTLLPRLPRLSSRRLKVL